MKHFGILTVLVLQCITLPNAVVAQLSGDSGAPPRTFYVAAGADGNGLDAATPFGSTEEVETTGAPGDIIVVLPGEGILDGGLALKPGQILRGAADGSRRPVISNTTEDRNGGVGVILASGVRIEGIEIHDTYASGVFGLDVGDIAISEVSIRNANTGRGVIVPDFLGPFPHGGVALLTSPGTGVQRATLSGVRVTDATGMGIGIMAVEASQVTLVLNDVEVTGGAGMGPSDYGIAVIARGSESEASLEMTRSQVRGRMTPAARNIALAAGSSGAVRGLIYESFVGESGQDGVLAVALTLPATVDVSIVGSTIEGGAQSNVEGTLLALPHEEEDLLSSSMAISIHRSTIRNAGSGPLFEEAGANVYMTGSFLPPNQPLPAGQYSLRVTDSEIEGGSAFGVALGTNESLPTADPGHFNVLLRGNRFLDNRVGDIMIGGPNARVDARENCWSSPDGAMDARVVTYWIEGAAPADTSAAISCQR